MSVYVMTWVFMHSPAAGNDRLVLLAIADEADDEGLNARPSVRRLAVKSRASVSTAVRCTSNLEAGGELLVLRPETRGRGRFNRYAVVMGRDPLALAEALGWPPPTITGPPEEWNLDEIDTTAEAPGEPELMVSKCEHSPGEERSTSRGNGVAGDTQKPEERSGMVSPVRADPLTLGSIDPRAAAPVPKSNPRPNPVPADSVPASLSTGLGHRNRRPADPLDGIAAAGRAIADRARAEREAEEAESGPLVESATWRDDLDTLRHKLRPTEVSIDG